MPFPDLYAADPTPLNASTVSVALGPVLGAPIVIGPVPPTEIVAYGLEIFAVIVIPGPWIALRTSPPSIWALMNVRNHAGSQVFGIESVLAPVMPAFDFSGSVVMLPLAVFDF